MFVAPGLGMGQHGTMLDPDGEGSLGMAAVPASRGSSLNPFSPSKPSDGMGWDTGRDPLFAHPGPGAY